MTFSEVIGQSEAKQRLLQLEEEHRLPHAMLLCGPQGSGKMALALAFASHLLGDGPMLRKLEHPDLHFSFPVIKPSGTSSDRKMSSDDFIREWRAMINESPYFSFEEWLKRMGAANEQAQIGVGESDSLMRKLSLKSSQGGYKICVMWLPERMNAECANKILKLLEEPPQQTVFLMVSEEPEKLLATIYSRVQRIDIKPIDEPSITAALMDRRGIEQEEARRVAHVANGSWLRAIDELSADSENREWLEMYANLMRTAYRRDVRQLKTWSTAASALGRERQKRMLAYFLNMVRESFMYNFHTPELNYMTRSEENFVKNFAPFVNERNVVEMSEEMQRAVREISQNANPRMVFFDLGLKMIMFLLRK